MTTVKFLLPMQRHFSMEKQKAIRNYARNKALGNVTITCTATFNDGTQKSVNIKVKHQKLTGAQVQNSKFNKDKKYIFVTFEVDA